MRNSKHKGLLFAVLAVLFVCGALFFFRQDTESVVPEIEEEETQTVSNTVVYACTDGHSIIAIFHEGEAVQTAPGEIPVPTGSAEVSLDGGEAIVLNQTISASGVRYANEDESLIFWNKGNEAFIMRGETVDPQYESCAAQ